MADLVNELSWSFSRKRLFESCRRRYYYNHYLKWGGWDKNAPEERRVAYRLSKMTTMPIHAGQLVHEIIEQALQRYANNGMSLTLEEAIHHSQSVWQEALFQSLSGGWKTSPKHCLCFVEDYYQMPDRDLSASAAWERMEICIRNFWSSEVWEKLRQTDKRRWLAYDGDPYQTIDIEGVPVHARPDFSYDNTPSGELRRCLIFDWKTGKPRDSDVLQLRYYAFFAQSVWEVPVERVKAKLVYLYPNTVEQNEEMTPDRLEEARFAMVESFSEMKKVLRDVEANEPQDIEWFPVTQRAYLCKTCQFKEICHDRPEADNAEALKAGDPTQALPDWDPFAEE